MVIIMVIEQHAPTHREQGMDEGMVALVLQVRQLGLLSGTRCHHVHLVSADILRELISPMRVR